MEQASHQPRSPIVTNLANLVSVLGVLPICLLFLDDGYRYLIPLILFNNVMDDLDGIIATKLHIRSTFGAALDNVCDAVSHIVFVLAVGMHYGGICAAISLLPATAILLRVVSRVVGEGPDKAGSPTNELVRHMLFTLLLAETFEIGAPGILAIVFVLHSATLLVPFRMPGLLRGMARSTTAVALINVALVGAWLMPHAAPVIAAAFVGTYLYGLVVGGYVWLRAVPAT